MGDQEDSHTVGLKQAGGPGQFSQESARLEPVHAVSVSLPPSGPSLRKCGVGGVPWHSHRGVFCRCPEEQSPLALA